VAPRTDASPDAVGATPIGASGTPDLAAVAAEGKPAPPAVVAAVTATVHAIAACLNAGDPARAAELFGAAAAPAFFLAVPLLGGGVGGLSGTPRPLPEEQRTEVRVRDARVLPDGRATAFVDGHGPAGDFTLFAVFVQEGARYVIGAFAVRGTGSP